MKPFLRRIFSHFLGSQTKNREEMKPLRKKKNETKPFLRRLFSHFLSYFPVSQTREAITGFYLPEDVVTEILARLPVKSLLRFRCVCKSWYALMKNTSFISKHLHCASLNNDQTRIAIKYSEDIKIMVAEKPCFRAIISFLSNEAGQLSHCMASPLFDDDDNSCSNDAIFYGPCNGIICLLAIVDRIGCRRYDSFILLWNPATREIKRVSDSRIHPRKNARMVLMGIGFGIDPRSYDYKVLRIIGFMHPTTTTLISHPVMEVYDSSTDSWRILDAFFPKNTRIRSGYSTYLNGFYYWLAEDKEDGKVFVLSFDFAEEVFEKMPLPDTKNPYNAATLLKFKETLAFTADDPENSEVNVGTVVWVLDMNGDGKKKRAWTKLYVIPFPCVLVVGFLKSGEALLIIDGGHGDKLELYDPTAQLLKNLRVYDQMYSEYYVIDYVESLVSFKGAHELHPTG